MKHFLTEYSRKEFHAGYKAVKDVSAILSDLGYRPIVFYNKYGSDLLPRIIRFFSWLYLSIRIRRGDVVFLQWPYYRIHPISRLLNLLRKKEIDLQILIHDLTSLRQYGDSTFEFEFLKLAHVLIVHSEAMKDYLVSCGIDVSKMRVLTSFDYLTDDSVTIGRKNSKEIVFAGNLSKSAFLNKIPGAGLGIEVNCYGARVQLVDPLKYKGSFCPENVSILKGSWGLVWDGVSLDGCEGDFGDYIRYNSPHKISLYIVAGLPLIVWTESAMAGYVLENHLGIVVDSIRDICERISSVSEMEYQEMLSCVQKESISLRGGGHLRSVLEFES